MQKTKLGITVGLFGASIYFTGLIGGLLAVLLLAGYVLLFEENEWLKKNSVKAVTLLIFFQFLTAIINLIPDAIRLINYAANIFDGYVEINILTEIVNTIVAAIDIVEKVLFIVLGMKAFNQETISVPIVDKIVHKYM